MCSRRPLIPVAFALMAMLSSASHALESWPDGRSIRLVVAAPPGGSTEMIAKQLAEKLRARLAVDVVVENRPGAGGTAGTAQVAKEPPDGHTLLLGTVSTHSVAPSLIANLPYDPVRDFTALTLVATIPNAIVVNANSPARTLKDLIFMAKAQPGRLSYASNGPGTSNGLATALLAVKSGITMTDIPYKGSTPARNDLLNGSIDLMLDVVMTAEPYVHTGKLRALAVTSLKRNPLLPNVPTVAELGYPGFEANVWFGMFGPPRMPADLIARVHKELVAVIRDSNFASYVQGQGGATQTMSPAEFQAFVRSEVDKWSKVANDAGVKPN